jgi:alpha,alpha-trehalase
MTLTLDNLLAASRPLLRFIDDQWEALTKNARHGHDESVDAWRTLAATSTDGHLDDTDHANPYILYLPQDFVTPGGRFTVQFYWDSYFIVLALLGSDRFRLAKGMVDNLLYSIVKHGLVVPNRKRWAAGSQLPFLSQMVRAVYEENGDLAWLRNAVPVLEREYHGYWLNPEHLAHAGLSRYHALPWFPPQALGAITVDCETTWDRSPRFEADDVLDLLPVDLNSNLFVYETNFAYFAEQLHDEPARDRWLAAAATRRAAIDQLLWDDADGLYYDFNFRSGERKRVKSLAVYAPLFCGCAPADRAQRVCDNLPLFETPFGLATCDRDYGYGDRQWNYPVGWAPLHWIVYRGLCDYGHVEPARRIALKWLNLNFAIWSQTGALFEKYDVVHGSQQVLTDRYANQPGFGWTNAVFHLLVHALTTAST